MEPDELEKLVVELEEEMFAAAEELRFEYAAKLRDEIKELRRDLEATTSAGLPCQSGSDPFWRGEETGPPDGECSRAWPRSTVCCPPTSTSIS